MAIISNLLKSRSPYAPLVLIGRAILCCCRAIDILFPVAVAVAAAIVVVGVVHLPFVRILMVGVGVRTTVVFETAVVVVGGDGIAIVVVPEDVIVTPIDAAVTSFVLLEELEDKTLFWREERVVPPLATLPVVL